MKELYLILAALCGGVVDYANQIYSGDKAFSVMSMLIHLLSAVFFGWVVGTAASGFGYGEDIIRGAGGLGGFLGVRVADILTIRLKK